MRGNLKLLSVTVNDQNMMIWCGYDHTNEINLKICERSERQKIKERRNERYIDDNIRRIFHKVRSCETVFFTCLILKISQKMLKFYICARAPSALFRPRSLHDLAHREKRPCCYLFCSFIYLFLYNKSYHFEVILV